MKKSLIKNTFREIKNSKARFFSIMAIIALSCGFYCGIKATAPSMVHMADNYYQRTNLMDYRLVSNVGFETSDLDAVKNLDEVTYAEAGYFADVLSDYHNSAHEVRLIAVHDNLNELTLIDGRLPRKKGEIVVEDGNFSGTSPKIGETIKVNKNSKESNSSDLLSTFEYKVVGVVRSPMYVSYERGSTTVGDGSLDAFMYVHKSSFKTERFTEIYVKTKYSKGETVNEEYLSNIDKFKSKLVKVGKTQSKIFKIENIDEAQNTLDEKKQEFQDSKKEAEEKLSDAKKKLDEAEKEYYSQINEARQKISSGQIQLKNGYAEYYSGKEKYEEEIAKAEKMLKKSQKEYDKGIKQYNSGLKKYKKGEKEYNKSYDEFYKVTKPELEEKLKKVQGSLADIQGLLDSVEQALKVTADPGTIAVLTAQKNQLTPKKTALEKAVAEITSGIETGKTTLSDAKKELRKSKALLDKNKKKLETAKIQLKEGKAKLEKTKVQEKKKLDDAYKLLKSKESELSSAESQLEEKAKSGLEELNQGQKDYKDSKAKINKKLSKAEKKLNKAQKKLDQVERPKWYVFTREDNPGYKGFRDNTGRVDAVAAVFPVFFLLVALLVCLTTMTRLIDEKRTEIGTFKALGYSNASIVGKFLVYSTSAAVIGSAVGITLGVSILPKIIYNAYKMMYNMDDITIVPDVASIIINVAVALLCTTVVTAFACYKALGYIPAQLMRPKGPKSGKRILLEKVKPLWSRFSFTSKVTARNIFRYKSRMFMTVLGVAGCTSLIVAAFGLQDSLNAIASIQFDEIYSYNAVVVADTDSTEEISNLNTEISEYKNVNSSAVVAFIDGEAKSPKSYIDSLNICVPQNLKEFSKLVNLRTREKHTPLEFSDNSVIITEKMSKLLNVGVGDSIKVAVDDVEKSLKISGISEQYVGHYIYMTPALYEKSFGKIDYSTVFVELKDVYKTQSDFGNMILKRDDVSAVSFIQSSVDELNDMLKSLNMVVFIMILCAGALAFVVLYNLTNINIAERIREIATIKVLGFNNLETSAFIYRENIALVILGILLGLLMGTFLSGWIVTTVELDNVQFGRTIHWVSYLWATLLTALFSLVVNFIMYFKMKNVNMVESLKSVE